MKKMIMLLFIAMILSKAVMAQTPSKDSLPASADSGLSKEEKMNPYIELKNGKLILIKNGNQSSPLIKETALKNGNVVLLDGTVKTTDGLIIQLSEGDKVYLNGLIIKKK